MTTKNNNPQGELIASMSPGMVCVRSYQSHFLIEDKN